MFAICTAAIFAAVGAAIDYSRAATVRTEMQAALDAATLMLAKEASGLSATQLSERANAYFLASFKSPQAKAIVVTPNLTTTAGVSKLRLDGSGSIDTTVFRIFGTMKMDFKASSEVMSGMRRLELALALDNTGSMAEQGKLDALKVATHSLIDTLQKTSKKKDDIRVAIIPFTTFVNVDPKANKKATWIDFADWSENTAIGTEAGLTTEWINKKTGAKWTGCVTDRAQPYDTQDVPPTSLATMFPAAECVNPGPSMTLTSNWKKLSSTVDAMKPDGTTNVTIGLEWAWHSLTTGQPLTQASAAAPDLDKVIILLTDGENTENRFTTSTPAIDKRTEAACANIKKDGIKLYTVRVIEGNAQLLKGCATSPAYYFEVQQASQLNAVFKSIADSLATLHISK
jgi:Mg-chelatase subunit ChlD